MAKAKKFATASLNLSKIDKDKLFTGKNGKYVNVVIWFNPEVDQYGNDFAVQQSASKEEREAGWRGNYLGNGKYVEMGGQTISKEEQDKLDF